MTRSFSPPFTDVEVRSVTAVVDVVQGNTTRVNVTLRNAGNQYITAPFDVTLTDETDGGNGEQAVAGLPRIGFRPSFGPDASLPRSFREGRVVCGVIPPSRTPRTH